MIQELKIIFSLIKRSISKICINGIVYKIKFLLDLTKKNLQKLSKNL